MPPPSEIPQYLNVWLVSANRVYRGVPFSVVGDWLQEGRITGRDCVRASNDQNWQYISDNPFLKPFLAPPPVESDARTDAEALEEITASITPKKPEGEEEDPDMIPLIDISMVLLVFFMMTAQDLLTKTKIETPAAEHAEIADRKKALYVSLEPDPGGNPNKTVYYFGDFISPEHELTEDQAVEKVKEAIQKRQDFPDLIIRADARLPYERVRDLTMKLKETGCAIKANVKEQKGAPPGGEGGSP
jgi:biopolymer transport protein ExbD